VVYSIYAGWWRLDVGLGPGALADGGIVLVDHHLLGTAEHL
jgi:hypothetical protein